MDCKRAVNGAPRIPGANDALGPSSLAPPDSSGGGSTAPAATATSLEWRQSGSRPSPDTGPGDARRRVSSCGPEGGPARRKATLETPLTCDWRPARPLRTSISRLLKLSAEDADVSNEQVR